MSVPEFGWVMVTYFWPLFIIALPGIYLLGRDTVKGIHEKTQSKPKKESAYQVEGLLRTTEQREHNELPLAQI